MQLFLLLAFFLASYQSVLYSSASAEPNPYQIDLSLLMPLDMPTGNSESMTLSEFNRDFDQYEQLTHEKREAVLKKINQLASKQGYGLVYEFVTQANRVSRAAELLKITRSLKIQVGISLDSCLRSQPSFTFDLNNQRDFRNCAGQALHYLNQIESGRTSGDHPSDLEYLLEGLVFRSIDDLHELAIYRTHLIDRLALMNEIISRFMGLRAYYIGLHPNWGNHTNSQSTLNASEESISSVVAATHSTQFESENIGNNGVDIDFTCHPGMPEMRLDREFSFKGQTIVGGLRNAVIQDQGFLDTCSAHAADLAIEALTGIQSSPIDLIISGGISVYSGSNICSVLKSAQTHGVCLRNNSPLEAFTSANTVELPEKDDARMSYRAMNSGPSDSQWRMILENAFKNYNSDVYAKAVKHSTEPSFTDAIYQSFSKTCADPKERITLPKMSCKQVELLPSNTRGEFSQEVILQLDREKGAIDFNRNVIESLSRGAPLGISYCTRHIFSEPPENTVYNVCNHHASVIAGIQFDPKIQRCNYLLLNSYGLHDSKIWVDSHLLAPTIRRFQVVSLIPEIKNNQPVASHSAESSVKPESPAVKPTKAPVAEPASESSLKIKIESVLKKISDWFHRLFSN